MAFDQSETKLDYTNMRNKPGLKIGQNIKKDLKKSKFHQRKNNYRTLRIPRNEKEL